MVGVFSGDAAAVQSKHGGPDFRPLSGRDHWIRVDQDDIITALGEEVSGTFADTIGSPVWDALPREAREGLGEILRLTRDTGHGSAVIYGANAFFSLLARRVGSEREVVVSFDYIPVSGLRDSIAEAMEVQERSERPTERAPATGPGERRDQRPW